MNIFFWETIILIFAATSLLATIIFLLIAKTKSTLKKSIYGALFGLAAAITVTGCGLVAALIASLILRYPLEIALSIIMSIAVTAIPIGAYIGGRK